MHSAESPSQRPLLEALRDESYKPVVVMGDGQIAMMLVQECHRLGKPVVVIGNGSPENAPKSSVQAMNQDDYYVDLGSDWDISREQGTMVALAEKLKKTEIGVTAEWENVPLHLLNFFESRGVLLTPGKKAFAIMSDKGKEKEYFNKQDIPCTEWCHVDDSLTEESAEKYLPGFLKSCKGGYDSKGQIFVKNFEELQKAKNGELEVNGEKVTIPGPHILEKKVELDYEFSVIFARDDGGMDLILSVQINHQDGPLISTVSGPGILPADIEKQAIIMARKAADSLEYVGTGTMEFFVSRDGAVLANEMAPRPHNSGHPTIQSHDINQYTTQALIASMGKAITTTILGGEAHGISVPDVLTLTEAPETYYFRAKPIHPDMITVLVNVVGERANWKFPDEVVVQRPGAARPEVTPGTAVLTWYGKPGDKNTKHGHITVTGTKEQVHVRVKKLLEHCYPEQKVRYIKAFENNLMLAA